MKKLLYLSAIFCLIVLVAGCGSKTAMEHKEKIIVGINAYTPPMGFADKNNQIIGFDVDLAKAVAERLRCDVEVKPLDNAKTDELQNDNVDILWNTLDVASKEDNNVIFTKPYMRDRQIVFVAKSSPIGDLNDLNGKSVGIRSGSIAQNDISKNLHLKKMFSSIVVYKDPQTEFQALQEGRVAAVIDSEMIGRYYMQHHKGTIKALDVTIGKPIALRLAFKKNDTALRDKVQAVLNEMGEDGTLAKISEKWFGNDVTLY